MFRKIFLIILAIIFFLFPSDVSAQENFATAYNVTYAVADDANTKATFRVSLTNKTSQYFVSSYKLQVGFDNIDHVVAADSSGDIVPKITKNAAGNEIDLKFNTKAVGQNKKLDFTLEFYTPDVAKKQGNIVEINIPGIANPDDFDDFKVTVEPPPGFSVPTYSKPEKKDGTLTYTKNELGKSGISIAFGKSQVYEYAITYHLKNTNVFPITTEIALPPNTNYQKVAIDSLKPKPKDVIVDKDGNWLAKYDLAPTEKISVIAKGRAMLSLEPEKVILSQSDRKRYLQPEKYWEVNDPKIRQLAKELKTPENIYKYVVTSLHYDFKRISGKQERLGGAATLANPESAVCLEFTDLFITLSRAAGIPARELNGYAYTENVKQRPLSLVQDILHAWPEYYDDQKQTWVMVDPTWGNTTGGIDYLRVFDFDHFVFVRKGEDSRYPIPAGGYKYEEDRGKKDVKISFSKEVINKAPKLSIDTEIAPVYASGFPINGTFIIHNTGSVMSYEQQITVSSSNLNPSMQKVAVPAIPPYGKTEVPFTFDAIPLLTNNTYDFTIDFKGEESKHKVKVTPFILNKTHIAGGVIIGLSSSIIFIIAYKARSLYISRRKK
jgi:transglutaminase-like putative cysteine protease